MSISIIAAVARNGVIGRAGKLPWHLPADLQHFKKTTMGKPVIMGRKTWESIGKPLPGRQNIVVTSRKIEGAQTAASLKEAIAAARGDEIFVIGGARLFAEAMQTAQRLYLTFLDSDFEGDVRFPQFDRTQWRVISEEAREPDEKNLCRLTFITFERMVEPVV